MLKDSKSVDCYQWKIAKDACLSFKFQNKFVFVENSAVELHTGRAWVPPELSEKCFSFIRGWPPQSRRTQVAAHSNLSLSLKTFRFAQSPICSGYDAWSGGSCSARLDLRKWATAPLQALQA